jgi:hypothetical protein
MPESASAAPAPRPWLDNCMRCTRCQAPTTSVAFIPTSSGASVLWMALVTAPGLRPGCASPYPVMPSDVSTRTMIASRLRVLPTPIVTVLPSGRRYDSGTAVIAVIFMAGVLSAGY